MSYTNQDQINQLGGNLALYPRYASDWLPLPTLRFWLVTSTISSSFTDFALRFPSPLLSHPVMQFTQETT